MCEVQVTGVLTPCKFVSQRLCMYWHPIWNHWYSCQSRDWPNLFGSGSCTWCGWFSLGTSNYPVTAICNYQGKTYNSPLMNWLQIAINSSERRFGTCHNNALPVCGHSVLQVTSGLLLVWSSDPAASMCFYLATFYDGISEQQMLRLSIMYKECWKHTSASVNQEHFCQAMKYWKR